MTQGSDPKKDLGTEFLFKEYDNAVNVTFHADTLRDRLSTFFISFAGAAVAFVGWLFKDEVKSQYFGDINLTGGLFLFGVSVIGVLILGIHGRLRRVQLEHFELISRIRVYCFGVNLPLWNTIRLSPVTLPKIKFFNFSGSELWALTILLPTAAILGTSVDLFVRLSGRKEWVGHAGAAIVGLVAAVGLWHMYAHLAKWPRLSKKKLESENKQEETSHHGHSKITVDEARKWLDAIDPALFEDRQAVVLSQPELKETPDATPTTGSTQAKPLNP